MTLSDALILLRKSYKYLLLVGIVGALALSIYVYLDNPRGDLGFGSLPKPKFTSIVSKDLTFAGNASLKGQIPRLQNVYRFETQQLTPQKLAEKLSFNGMPKQVREVATWSADNKLLTVENDLIFTYLDSTPVAAGSLTENDALKIAQNKLKELDLIGQDVVLQNIQTRYLKYGPVHEEEVSKGDDYNVLVFNLGIELEGLDLVRSNGEEAIYSISIATDKKIKKISGFVRKLAFTEKSTYPVKHLASLRSLVSDGGLTIVNAEIEVKKDVKILEVVYNSWELVYYLEDTKEEYLQPVYILQARDAFRGTSLLGVIEALKDGSYGD